MMKNQYIKYVPGIEQTVQSGETEFSFEGGNTFRLIFHYLGMFNLETADDRYAEVVTT